MTDLSAFPITKRWPAKNPDLLQLYSLPTPNGVKISIMLEEIGLPYEVHLVDFGKDDQKTPEFLSLNPNGKIPAIIDPNGPGTKPLGLFESGAILQYLAEKTAKLLPSDAVRRYETGYTSRWAASGRCSARSATSTNSLGKRLPTSGRSSAMSRSQNACWAWSRRASTGGNGSWTPDRKS